MRPHRHPARSMSASTTAPCRLNSGKLPTFAGTSLRSNATRDGVKIVIVERADRLARDLMVSEVIIDQMTQAGAKVLTADGTDLSSAADDPARTLIRQVLSAVAQFDKSVTVLKLRAARKR